MKIRILTLLLVLLASPVAFARKYSVEEVPNPRTHDARNWVSDPEGILSVDTRQRLNSMAQQMKDSLTVEVAIVVVPDIDTDIELFTNKLFERFGVGGKDKDNGVMIVLAPEGRQVRIEPGYGLEGVLPDVECSRIIDELIVPNMQNGDPDTALVAAMTAINKEISDPTVREEIRSKGEDLDRGAAALEFFALVCGMMFVVALFYFLWLLSSAKRQPDMLDKARTLYNGQRTMMWLGILGGVIGLVFYFIVRGRVRSIRNARRCCAKCGTPMDKLSEEMDNLYLSPSQDLEERIKSVDYDVWGCPKCGAVEKYAFLEPQKKYTRCPKCHTVADQVISNRTVRRATRYHDGEGIKTYRCMHCGNVRDKRYVIPRDEGGGVIGGFGGGSGGGGGSFGGGRSGGGGASGRW